MGSHPKAEVKQKETELKLRIQDPTQKIIYEAKLQYVVNERNHSS